MGQFVDKKDKVITVSQVNVAFVNCLIGQMYQYSACGRDRGDGGGLGRL